MALTREEAMTAMKTHFRGKLAKPKVKVTVNDWLVGDEPLTFYVGPQTMQVKGLIREGVAKSDVEGVVSCIIARAENENGEKIFIPNDRNWMLTEVDPDILSRTASKMIEADESFEDSPKDAEGN